jgi:putative flippase GtrA
LAWRLAPQAVKFAVIGFCATALHFTTLSLLIEVGRLPWPTLASAIGSVVGIATSYFGNYLWTFARTEPHRQFVVRFVASYLFSMAANTCFFYVQTNYLRVYYMTAFVVATGASTTINFALCKIVVFERRPSPGSNWRVRPAPATGDGAG